MYCFIMTSFLTKTLEILHKDFSKFIIAHAKFGLIRIKGSRVKWGGGRIPPPLPRPERVLEIPAWIGLIP